MATNPSEGHRARSYDSDCLRDLIARERAAYVEANPRSQELAVQARRTLLAGVPMSFMGMLAGAFPLFFTEARGNRVVDADGHAYVDFCLGDTGAMTGHSPEVVTDAVDARLRDEGRHHHDAPDGGCRLRRRRPPAPLRPALLAVLTDGDRRQPLGAAHGAHGAEAALRARLQRCYHGTVDETIIVVGPDGKPMAKPGNVGPQVDPTQTTKVVEFNDVEALRAALAPRDVAAVLMEPWMTNIGIVPAEPGSSRPCASCATRPARC